jgi:hypothetical protein
MNNSASLTAVQGPSMVARMIATSQSQLPHCFISSLHWVKASENTNLCTNFLLQIWKQQETQPCYGLPTNNTRRKKKQKDTT